MLRILIPAMMLSACAMSPREAASEQARDARDAARLDKQLAGYTPGTPVSCIDLRSNGMTIYGDTLLYRQGGRYFLNRTTGGCFGLRRDDIVVNRSYTGRLCRGDIVRTVDRVTGFPSGACSYGDFVPYTRAGRR